VQYQIPQFIETEDKIVGPFSIRQFVIVCGAGGMAAMLFFVLNTFIWFIVAIPIVGLGIALAFVKVNGRPFIATAMSAARYYWRPQTYVWQPEKINLPKGAPTTPAAPAFSLEKVVSGLALKSALQTVQTGSPPASAGDEVRRRSLTGQMANYQISERITGERKAARRVDYR